jgi:SAM-dependent MidA family methyltransferase
LLESYPRAHNQPAMLISSNDVNKSLGERLRARIERDGPISFRDWMQLALYDEREGYYCRSDRLRWGRLGDYRTAPESSPLFAATFARYFAKLYSELDSPSSWTIFEAGAGAGEFARGALTALQSGDPQAFAATSYVIDEASADARAQSAQRLSDFSDRVAFRSLAEAAKPASAAVVFSNELIDAFPVHRVTLRGGKLRELGVGLDDRDNFVWIECDLDKLVAEYCERAGLHLAEGQIFEINLGAEDFISRAASLLERGFVMTIDYGAERNELLNAPHRRQGTLRAFHQHQIVKDVLARPGEQDLTTSVDWTQVREAGERAALQTVRHERLDQFLLQEGLLDVLEALAGELTNEAEVVRLRTSAREMIMPHGLATSFQILVQEKLRLASREVLR